jgi:hypothetical protein
MVQRSLKSLLLGRLALWLERWASFLDRQADLWASAARGSLEDGGLVNREAVPDEGESPTLPGVPTDGPPAHWLEHLRQSGRPLHWIEHRAGLTHNRPAGWQRPGELVRDPRPSQPAPSQPEISVRDGSPPRAPTELSVEDPQATQTQASAGGAPTQGPNRTSAEEVERRRTSRRPRPAPLAKRPARLFPRSGSEPEAATTTPAEEARRPRSRERQRLQPAGGAEAPEPGSLRQEKQLASRGMGPTPAATSDRTEPQRGETPVAAKAVLSRWPSLPESRPGLTAPVRRMGPIQEAAGEVDTHGVAWGAEGSAQPARRREDADRADRWISVDRPAIAGEAMPERVAKPAVRSVDMGLYAPVYDGDSNRDRAHLIPQAAHGDGTRRLSHEQGRLWEETSPGDPWPALPAAAFPGEELPEALTDEAWEVQRRTWQRLLRLDEEQKGNLWNAWLF